MIPDFDHNYVLPPHLGDPIVKADVSPYLCDTLEFCQTFATSNERIAILNKYLDFRGELNKFGVRRGFQWLNGSFSEDVESSLGRPPADLDLVTFYRDIPMIKQRNIASNFEAFIDQKLSKSLYMLDHYSVDYNSSPEFTVNEVKYWIQLFSHNRSGVWKGILRIELNTPSIDSNARKFLEALI